MKILKITLVFLIIISASVIALTFQVTYPNGGEEISNTIDVTAYYSRELHEPDLRTVDFYYLRDDGGADVYIGSYDVPVQDSEGTASVEWDTSDVDYSTNYKIRAELNTDSTSVTDYSDNVFTVDNRPIFDLDHVETETIPIYVILRNRPVEVKILHIVGGDPNSAVSKVNYFIEGSVYRNNFHIPYITYTTPTHSVKRNSYDGTVHILTISERGKYRVVANVVIAENDNYKETDLSNNERSIVFKVIVI